MKNKKLTIIFSILYIISLLIISYLCLAIGIALAFKNNGWFGYSFYTFLGMAFVTLICLCFIKKSSIALNIILIISLCFLFFIIIYLIINNILLENILLLGCFILSFILGLISLIFSLKRIKKQDLSQ